MAISIVKPHRIPTETKTPFATSYEKWLSTWQRVKYQLNDA